MRQKHEAKPESAEKAVRDIRRATRRPHAAEEFDLVCPCLDLKSF
jgi:hypothetical protein